MSRVGNCVECPKKGVRIAGYDRCITCYRKERKRREAEGQTEYIPPTTVIEPVATPIRDALQTSKENDVVQAIELEQGDVFAAVEQENKMQPVETTLTEGLKSDDAINLTFSTERTKEIKAFIAKQAVDNFRTVEGEIMAILAREAGV